MSTLQIVSLLANVILAITLLYVMFSSKVIHYINERKKLREKRSNLERARFVKDVREEVRRYLEELQK